jgi:hypothetical protein
VRILLTGDYRRGEFAGLVAEMSQAAEVVQVDDLNAAVDWLQGQAPVDLVVVAQGRPGQFSHSQLEAIRRTAPLAPIVALLGSWCEGETRSGSPWAGVTRVYWHQWRERFRPEIARLSRGEPGAWTQPLTATAEERLLWSGTAKHGNDHRLVAVVSDNCEIRDWLTAACQRRGTSTITLCRAPAGRIKGVSRLLWDAGLPSPHAIEAFRVGLPQFPGSQAVVLADFPRDDDVRSFLAAGAAAVFDKVTGCGW